MAKNEIPKVIAIVGPTASGKSDLALRLAKLAQGKLFKKKGILGAEIISADSRQVYRGMDVGTGKVLRDKTLPVPNTKFSAKGGSASGGKIQKQDFYSSCIRHHLIDVISPKKQFTANDFKKLGQKAINDILGRSKVPIIVGGTGFYIDVLLGRMSIAEVPPNKKLRKRFDKLSTEHLLKVLRKLDPERARTIESKNKRRLIRALEIVLTTSKPVPSQKPLISTSYAIAESVDKLKVLWLGLKSKNLEQRIKKRLNTRLRQGMIKEIIKLHKQGVSWKRLDDFGLEYRSVARYLRQNSKLEILNPKQIQNSKSQIQNFKKSHYYEGLLRDIIRYSKRQMTWFKRNKEIKWVNGVKEAQEIVNKFF